MPTSNAYAIVRPMSALYAVTAMSAAGCGGTSPCTTLSPATIGMPTNTIDVPVRFATVNAIGTSSTKPTSKNTGNADDERDRRHRPVHALLAERGDHGMRDALGAPRLGHHLAEHRPQRDDERDVAERVADAGLERLHDPRHRHADGDAECERDDDERDERVELVPRDQDDERDDRDGGVDEEE